MLTATETNPLEPPCQLTFSVLIVNGSQIRSDESPARSITQRPQCQPHDLGADSAHLGSEQLGLRVRERLDRIRPAIKAWIRWRSRCGSRPDSGRQDRRCLRLRCRPVRCRAQAAVDFPDLAAATGTALARSARPAGPIVAGPCARGRRAAPAPCRRHLRVRWRPRVVLLAEACQNHPHARRVCDAFSLPGGRVIRVHHSSDSKLGSYFAEGLEQAGLSRAAPILSAEADDDAGLLKVTVALSSVADWNLRSQVHQVAMGVEDEHDVTVLCYFRPLDPVPFAAKQRAPARALTSGCGSAPERWADRAIAAPDSDDGPRAHALKVQPSWDTVTRFAARSRPPCAGSRRSRDTRAPGSAV